MVLTGVTVIGLLAFYQGQYREITWKDFVANYLSRGVVSCCFCCAELISNNCMTTGIEL